MTAALLDRPTTRRPVTGQTRRPARPKLRVLDQAATRRRARHRSALLILFVAVLVGFFAVAFVHAELVAGQHELDAVRTEISQAEARHAELARVVEEASAPGVIVTRATELGMVRAHRPVYLTATGPVPAIEAGPPLAAPTPTGTADDVDGGPVDAVAAPPGAAAADGGRLHGTLGQAGGISAAIRLPQTPALAVGVDPSPSGVTADADDPAASTTPGTAASTATTVAPAPAGPVSSIAGTRAVSTPAGGSAASTASSPVGGSAASSAVGGSAVESISARTAPAGDDPAGGLASVAATTSG